MYFILLKSAVHRHEGGTRLGTCLVNAACVVGFVACVNADKFSVMYLILLKSLMHGHGRCTRLGTCLVYTPCLWPLLHVRMLINFLFMYLAILLINFLSAEFY